MSESPEKRQRAKELYVFRGLTLEEAATQSGAALASVRRWSADEGWKAMQAEYREARADINHYTVLLRARLVKRVFETLSEGRDIDSQALYALNKMASGAGSDEMPVNPESVDIETAADAVDVLNQAVENKLGVLLARPEALSCKAVRDVKETLALMEDIKARYGKKDDRRKGLSSETVEQIKARILGVN